MTRFAYVALLLCALTCRAFDASPLVQFCASGATWTPLNLPGLNLWLDASDASTLTLSNDYVAAWADKSGQNHNVSQADTSLRRIYVAADSVANGMPSVSSMDSTRRYLTLGSALSVTQMFFVVAYKDGLDSTFDDYATIGSGTDMQVVRVGMGNSGDNLWYAPTTLNMGVASKNGGAFTNAALPMKLCVCRFNFAAESIQTWRIGASSLTQLRGWQGPICEVVFVTGALSETDAAQLTAYLMAKWKITP